MQKIIDHISHEIRGMDTKRYPKILNGDSGISTENKSVIAYTNPTVRSAIAKAAAMAAFFIGLAVGRVLIFHRFLGDRNSHWVKKKKPMYVRAIGMYCHRTLKSMKWLRGPRNTIAGV